MDRLTGVHAVREALRAGRPLDRVVIARGRHGERIAEILRLARSRGVPVRFERRELLDRMAGGTHHQGVVALTAAETTVALDDLLARASPPGLLVVLDGVEDPRNLGAVIRTALAAGASGVVIPERRAAGLTEAVAQAAAGALSYLPVARVTNLAAAIERIQAAGYWVVGFDERVERPYTALDLTRPVALVFGGEGRGLRELTRRRCDELAAIRTVGPIRSLNVSVAAGVVLFEALRQRQTQRS